MSERPPSRLEALQKRCDDAQPGFLNACDPQHAAEARALRGALLRTDLPDLARDFRTVAETFREQVVHRYHCARLVSYRVDAAVLAPCDCPAAPAFAIIDRWLGVPE